MDSKRFWRDRSEGRDLSLCSPFSSVGQEPFPPPHTCRHLCLPCCSSLWLHSVLSLQSKNSAFFLATDTSPVPLSTYLRLTWRLSCFYMEWGWIGFLLFIRSGSAWDPENSAVGNIFLPPPACAWIDRQAQGFLPIPSAGKGCCLLLLAGHTCRQLPISVYAVQAFNSQILFCENKF